VAPVGPEAEDGPTQRDVEEARMPERTDDTGLDDPGRRGERSAQAHDRAERAAARAAELRERQVRLREGTASGPGDVHAARTAAAEGLASARQALHRATTAHEFAAEAHDRVAGYLEELARQGGPSSDRWLRKAEQHRAGAAADRRAGQDDERRETGEPPG
jgi:hypothetical protein